jgi:uncharacterized membrane protein
MSRERVIIPPLDTAPLSEGLDRALSQIKEIRSKFQKRLAEREKEAAKTVRDAFYAGFKRSDMPPPSEDRIEAAFRHWMQQQ